MDTQLEYLALELGKDEILSEYGISENEYEICESKYRKFVEIKTLDEATEYFCKKIEIVNSEKSHMDLRKTHAQEIWEEIK